jgi:hypothetical protein
MIYLTKQALDIYTHQVAIHERLRLDSLEEVALARKVFGELLQKTNVGFSAPTEVPEKLFRGKVIPMSKPMRNIFAWSTKRKAEIRN